MNEQMNNGAEKASARRRLIRGAFAAPAALTLCSGSAFAAASNQRCVAKQVNGNPQLPVPSVNPTDTWVRVQVYKSGNTQIVKGADIVGLQGTALNTYISASEWKTVANPSVVFNPNGNTPKVVNGKSAALRVDQNGVIVGISTGAETNSSAVTKSCWTSFSGVGFFH